MNDDTTNAATTIAHCQDCDSTVHVVHRPHKVMSIEVEHSPTCPAWKHDRREVALMFTPSAAQQ
jgi:hypothetical protein